MSLASGTRRRRENPLFRLPGRGPWQDYYVALDGKRFLAIVTDVLGTNSR